MGTMDFARPFQALARNSLEEIDVYRLCVCSGISERLPQSYQSSCSSVLMSWSLCSRTHIQCVKQCVILLDAQCTSVVRQGSDRAAYPCTCPTCRCLELFPLCKENQHIKLSLSVMEK